jgi:hypothetical protein
MQMDITKKILPLAWIDRLFMRLSSIYLSKWTDNFKNNEELLQIAKREWAEGLAGLDGEQIKKGLDSCRKSLEWPPSIATFRTLCREGSTGPKLFSSSTQVLEHCKNLSGGFKENIERVMKQNADMNIKHPTWEEKKYTSGWPEYDRAYANERKYYLLKLTDIEALNLCREDMYDRIRLLGESREVRNPTHWGNLG